MNSLSKPSNEVNKSKRQSIAIEKGSPSIQGELHLWIVSCVFKTIDNHLSTTDKRNWRIIELGKSQSGADVAPHLAHGLISMLLKNKQH